MNQNTGHETGPKNDATVIIVNKLDSLFGAFMDKMKKLSIFDK